MNEVILGRIVSREGPVIGLPRSRTYTVRWRMPDGSEMLLPGCSTRELHGTEVHRVAFLLGAPVLGVLTDAPGFPQIMIIDREDYAVGCG